MVGAVLVGRGVKGIRTTLSLNEPPYPTDSAEKDDDDDMIVVVKEEDDEKERRSKVFAANIIPEILLSSDFVYVPNRQCHVEYLTMGMNNARRKQDMSIFREMLFSRSIQHLHQEHKAFDILNIVDLITGQLGASEFPKYLEVFEEGMSVDFNDRIMYDVEWLRPELHQKLNNKSSMKSSRAGTLER